MGRLLSFLLIIFLIGCIISLMKFVLLCNEEEILMKATAYICIIGVVIIMWMAHKNELFSNK